MSKPSAFSPWPVKSEDTTSQQRHNNDAINDASDVTNHDDIAERSDDDEEEEEDDMDDDDDDVNVDEDVPTSNSTLNSSTETVDTSVRHKPSIFSVSSLLSDDKSDRNVATDEKEEDEITLPFPHPAIGKPPFFYPG